MNTPIHQLAETRVIDKIDKYILHYERAVEGQSVFVFLIRAQRDTPYIYLDIPLVQLNQNLFFFCFFSAIKETTHKIGVISHTRVYKVKTRKKKNNEFQSARNMT